jgi:hypothetical protein
MTIVASGDAKLGVPEYIQAEGLYGACVAFKAADRKFKIGLFGDSGKDAPRTSSASKPPGIPLDPNVLRQREITKVERLELEFESIEGTYASQV